MRHRVDHSPQASMGVETSPRPPGVKGRAATPLTEIVTLPSATELVNHQPLHGALQTLYPRASLTPHPPPCIPPSTKVHIGLRYNPSQDSTLAPEWHHLPVTLLPLPVTRTPTYLSPSYYIGCSEQQYQPASSVTLLFVWRRHSALAKDWAWSTPSPRALLIPQVGDAHRTTYPSRLFQPLDSKPCICMQSLFKNNTKK